MTKTERIETLNFIVNHLGRVELFTALAEESSELTKAALKVLRARGDVQNPTPITYDEAFKNLVEEVADVFVCLYAIGIIDEKELSGTGFGEIADTKLKRWADRLEGKDA